jgi:hypothetical protein
MLRIQLVRLHRSNSSSIRFHLNTC